MSIREKVEQNIVIWTLATIAAGFVAGFGANQAILEIAERETAPKGTVAKLKADLAKSQEYSANLQQERANMILELAKTKSIPDLSIQRLLIKRNVESHRRNINDAFDQIFIPRYVNSFVRKGKLIELATTNQADLVEAWARIAVETLDKERSERLAPIDRAEQSLLRILDEALDPATYSDEMDVAVQIQEIRNRITKELDTMNDKASRTIDDIRKKAVEFGAR